MSAGPRRRAERAPWWAASVRAAELVVLLVALTAGACNNEQAIPAGATSAPGDPSKADPKCMNASPDVERERCRNADLACCKQLLGGQLGNLDSYLSAFTDFSIACGGGLRQACDDVRDSRMNFSWKLGVLRGACSTLGGASCRHAVLLAALVDPSR